MKNYQVDLELHALIQADNREELALKLYTIIQSQGFQEKDFIISIKATDEPVKPTLKAKVEEPMEAKQETGKEIGKVIRRTSRRA